MPPTRRLRIGSIAFALVLTAGCGSGDDEPAAEPAPEPAPETTDEPAPETTAEPAPEADGDPADDGLVTVDDLSDLPDGCVELFVEFMTEIEPSVEDIDWESATLADLSAVGEEVQAASGDFGTRSTELGCEQYDPESEDTVYRELLELARREAPGAVGFYEFLNSLAEDAGTPVAPTEESATDCADAIETIERFVAEYDSYNDIPMSELEVLGRSMTTVTGACTLEEGAEFFERADIAEFFTG